MPRRNQQSKTPQATRGQRAIMQKEGSRSAPPQKRKSLPGGKAQAAQPVKKGKLFVNGKGKGGSESDEAESEEDQEIVPVKSVMKGKVTPVKKQQTPKAQPQSVKFTKNQTPAQGKATPVKGKQTPKVAKGTPVSSSKPLSNRKATPFAKKQVEEEEDNDDEDDDDLDDSDLDDEDDMDSDEDVDFMSHLKEADSDDDDEESDEDEAGIEAMIKENIEKQQKQKAGQKRKADQKVSQPEQKQQKTKEPKEKLTAGQKRKGEQAVSQPPKKQQKAADGKQKPATDSKQKTQTDSAVDMTGDQKRKQESNERTLFVKGFPEDTSEADLRLLSKDIKDIRLRYSYSKAKKKKVFAGFAFLEFATKAAAEKNMAIIKKKKIKDHSLNVQLAKWKATKENEAVLDMKRLFITGYGDMTNEALQKIFPSAKEVVTPMRRDGKPHGFAFAVFDSEEKAKKSHDNSHGKVIKGRSIVVVYARARKENNQADSGKKAEKVKADSKKETKAKVAAAKKTVMEEESDDDDDDDDEDEDDLDDEEEDYDDEDDDDLEDDDDDDLDDEDDDDDDEDDDDDDEDD